MNAAIQISRLEKSYGGRPVLRGLTFHVKRGEIFALLGVNGAGKTTLMKILFGIEQPTSGAIRIQGKAEHVGAYLSAAFGTKDTPQDLSGRFP